MISAYYKKRGKQRKTNRERLINRMKVIQTYRQREKKESKIERYRQTEREKSKIENETDRHTDRQKEKNERQMSNSPTHLRRKSHINFEKKIFCFFETL